VRHPIRTAWLALALGLAAVPADAADRQIRPWVGVNFGGDTTFLDLDGAVGKPHLTFGVNTLILGEIVGIEADVGRSPGFFQAGGSHLVLDSSVTTITGNIVIAVPQRLTQYSLRPYFVGGFGAMRVQTEDFFQLLPLATWLAAMDVGGGVTGFITKTFGVNWEIRRFQSLGEGAHETGLTIGPDQLSFWRASMAFVIRY